MDEALDSKDVWRQARDVVERHLDEAASFAESRARATDELNSRLPAGSFAHLAPGDEDIAALLDPQWYGWSHERPPLNWYAGAIAASHLFGRLPDSATKDLLGAANYYGDSNLVHEIARANTATTNDDLRSSILKHAAKAYKNDGNFDDARACYRKALLLAHAGSKVDLVAYFLLLFAKLCDHYEQRVAWHRTFHRFAHVRFERIAADAPSWKTRRWLQISEDALAKAIFDTDPEAAEQYFRAALDHGPLDEDGYARIKAHHQEAHLLRRLSSPEALDISRLERSFGDLWRLFKAARALGNERAANVRRLQYVRLARLAATRLVGGRGRAVPAFAEPLLEGEWEVDTTGIHKGAMRYSDRRTAAMAAFERAQWRLYCASGGRNEVSRTGFDLAISDMETALGLLVGTRDRMFDLYYEVAIELCHLYEMSRRWHEAHRLYEDTYEECNKIVGRIEQDECKLREPSSELQGMPELMLLEPAERERLTVELTYDYRLLLKRALSLCERLKRPQFQEAVDATRRLLARGSIQSHEVMKVVRKALPGSDAASTSARGRVEALLRGLDEAAYEAAVTCVDVPGEVRRVVARNHLEVDISALENQSVVVEFDVWVLHALVAELVDNAALAAERQGLPCCRIQIDVRVERQYLYLVVKDDAGDLAVLRNAIELVNAGERAKSRRSLDGGKGMLAFRNYMRDLLRVKRPWSVEALPDGMKALVIPIGPVCVPRGEEVRRDA
jgi:anti-sigma regulatory factor (Ser/Thr protein kinase)